MNNQLRDTLNAIYASSFEQEDDLTATYILLAQNPDLLRIILNRYLTEGVKVYIALQGECESDDTPLAKLMPSTFGEVFRSSILEIIQDSKHPESSSIPSLIIPDILEWAESSHPEVFRDAQTGISQIDNFISSPKGKAELDIDIDTIMERLRKKRGSE